MNTLKLQKKEIKENLIWINDQTGEMFHAGVAFYIEQFGEYRLVLDAPRTILYLRPSRSGDGKIYYVIQATIENNGKFSHRVEVGNGYSDDKDSNHIYMKLGRYSNQQLVLVTSKEETFY